MAPTRTPFRQLDNASHLSRRSSRGRSSRSSKSPIAPMKLVPSANFAVREHWVPLREPLFNPDETRHWHEQVARTTHPSRFDAELGRMYAKALGKGAPAITLKPKNRISEIAVRAHAASVGLRQHAASCTEDVIRLAFIHGQAADVRVLPIIFLSEVNSPGIASIDIAGKHGYAYMFPRKCAGLLEDGAFHLFNNPTKTHEAMVGDKLKEFFDWRYCGIYRAHKTEHKLTPAGWDALPEHTRKTAPALAKGKSGKLRDDEIPRALKLLRLGVQPTPLVLFECLHFSRHYRDLLTTHVEAELMPVKPLAHQRVIPPREELERQHREDDARKASARARRSGF
ncbi:hypothetical protein BD413DRAFT_608576 [Trametes elegans]|nr:hypothetical protein BD413DRAFT_608576 [Trametes elegans]